MEPENQNEECTIEQFYELKMRVEYLADELKKTSESITNWEKKLKISPPENDALLSTRLEYIRQAEYEKQQEGLQCRSDEIYQQVSEIVSEAQTALAATLMLLEGLVNSNANHSDKKAIASAAAVGIRGTLSWLKKNSFSKEVSRFEYARYLRTLRYGDEF